MTLPAGPHAACHITKYIQASKREELPHLPYSPDLAPIDIHLFTPLKDPLYRNRFRSEGEVEELVHDWLAQQPTDFFSQGIYTLVERWWRCVECGRCYTDVCHYTVPIFAVSHFI